MSAVASRLRIASISSISPRIVLSTLALSMALAPHAALSATSEQLEAQMQNLTQQLEALKAELAQMKAQQLQQAQQSAQASATTTIEKATNPTFFGYGELNYSRPRDDAAAASADVARFVIGVGYQFDERTHLVSELEIEHAVSSSSDPGEVEVEQAYIDHDLGHGLYAKAGLFLIPVGLLNENHEPTRYYGVFRNLVETSIIPTTWREGGLAVQGNTASGLRWDAGVSTGFDLSKWTFGSDGEGKESPLGSIHQEMALARAKDLSFFAALNYTGIESLKVGASLFTGGASQGQENLGFHNNDVTLWEGHARWTPGAFDLAALYAHGHISGTQAINTSNVGNPILIPENFFGWYVQGAYQLWQHDSYKLSPFVRYERFNTASSYAILQAGLTPVAAPDQQAWTGGFNFNIASGVVLKADYLWFKDSGNSDRFDLGLGYQF